VEQLHAQFTLEVLDRQAERRLRDVQRGGCVGEGAVIRDGEKVLKAASIDRATLYHLSNTGL
jgi:hypothetical protein